MSELIGANSNTKFGILKTAVETSCLQVNIQHGLALAVTTMPMPM
jgi:hypothetical protein